MAKTKVIGFKVPDDSDLLERLKEIVRQTRFEYCELLEKWITREEIELAQCKPTLFAPQIVESQEIDMLKTQIQAQNESISSLRQTVEELLKVSGAKSTPKLLAEENISRTKEKLMARVREYHSQGKSSEEIARMFTEEKIPTLTGRAVWNSSTIRDWLKEGRKDITNSNYS